ncbi:MAG: hypothetical protein NVS3B21_25650 [Acidimicrobiales bacterium]
MPKPRDRRPPWADLGRQIKDAVEEAVKKGPTSVAAVANVGKPGSHVSVYTDNDVTITNNNGDIKVVHHRPGGNSDPHVNASTEGEPPTPDTPTPDPAV